MRELAAERDVEYADLELLAGARPIRHLRCCAKSANFEAVPELDADEDRPSSQDIEDRFAPGQTAALIRDEQQQAMVAVRQLGAGHMQSPSETVTRSVIRLVMSMAIKPR